MDLKIKDIDEILSTLRSIDRKLEILVNSVNKLSKTIETSTNIKRPGGGR